MTYYLVLGADYLCPRHLKVKLTAPWPIPPLIDAKLASPLALEIDFRECNSAEARHEFGVRHYDKAEFMTKYKTNVLLGVDS